MPKFAKPWYRPERGVWYVTLDGKQHNLGPDRTAAFAQYAQLISRPRPKTRQQVPSQSLPAVIDAFLDWLKPRRSAATFEWYRYRLERLARRHPELGATRLTTELVEDWVDSYGLSKTSRRNYYRAIKKCMGWARSRRLIRRNPIRDLEVPAADSREICLTPQDYEQLLASIPDPCFRDLVVTTWETGCRPQELLRVEARHVDLAHQRWLIPKSESKTKKLVRVVYLTDAAIAITRRWMETSPQGKLFRNATGKPWTVSAVNQGFTRVRIRQGKAVMKERGVVITDEQVRAEIPKLKTMRTSRGRSLPKTAAELREEARRKLTRRLALTLAPRWSLYALRHSWATHALQRDVDPLTVAILMGHSDPSMLSKVYQHVALNPAHMLQQAKRAARSEPIT